ncbi:hypothetical protein SAMN02927924_01431 [Sphingobium faniae]|nr:hypothetical protein SAMN02927924_01431 [Sphingobium faniae]
MTQPIPIPFGPWEPDRASFDSGALTEAANVVPVAGGYGPTYGFEPRAASLTPPIAGAMVISNDRVSQYIYAGSGQNIYVSTNGAAFASVYATTGLSAPNRWQFARFVGKAIGVHPQKAPVGGDIGSAMTPLAGSPPLARVAGVVGNFLVLGDLDDGIDGPRPNRVRWSGFRNPGTWGTNIGTQADFNDMPDEGGIVEGVIGREFGTVFQRYMISRMTYIGPPAVFQFDVVEKKRGAIAPGAIIDAGLLAAFIADDGFFLWDGTSSTPIGAQRVNEYFRKRISPGTEGRITGMFDPLDQTVSWAYCTDDSGLLTERLTYSLIENRWTFSDLRGHWFMSGFDIGYTLEQLDQFGPLDTLPFSLDDPKLLGGQPRAVGFDASGNYGALNGGVLEARFETGDWQAAPGSRAFVNAVRPMVDAQTVTCAAGTRQQVLHDPISWTPDCAQATDGRCPMRASGRYVRARTNIPAGQSWTRATGIEVHASAEGLR